MPPSRLRRADILAAAGREFAQAGYAGGRVERIAAAAQVNKQLLFHYFGSRDGLFTAAISSLLEEQQPRGESSGSPAEALRRNLAAVHAKAVAIPSLGALLAEAPSPGRLPGEAASRLLAWRDREIARLVLVLEEGQRRGYFRDDMEPISTARLGFAAAIGAFLLRDLESPVLPGAFVADYCAWR